MYSFSWKCENDVVSNLFAALSVDKTHGLDYDSFIKSMPLLLHAVYQIETVCIPGTNGTEFGQDAVPVLGTHISAGEGGVTLSKADLEEILLKIGERYVHTTEAEVSIIILY